MVKNNLLRNLCCSFLLVACSFVQIVDAKEKTNVKPVDVLVAVKQLSGDLELVREKMGKPAAKFVEFKVKNAEPRHLYFHSQTIFRKVNKLAQEVADVDRLVPAVAPEEDELTDGDVLGLIKQVQSQLDLVKSELGIAQAAEPDKKRRWGVKDRDVMLALMEASQRTSQLLTEKFTPKDVYRQLTRSSNYVAGVLAKYEGVEPFPPAPALQPDAQPIDVLVKMGECMELNQKVGKKTKIPVLVIDAAGEQDDGTEQPSPAEQEEVQKQLRDAGISINYETATLLLADIGYWSWKLEAEDEPPPNQEPKEITTSIVLQKASVLATQLQSLLKQL